MLLTTPEQVALLLSHADAPQLFADLDTVILDELHALAPTKRGDLLALDLARLATLAPGHVRIGLSATVARPSELRAYLVPQSGTAPCASPTSSVAEAARRPDIRMLETEAPLPWAGHTSRYAVARDLRGHQGAPTLSLVFVNTRSQAELLFQELWRVNDDGLPIALHHGSLDAARRRKVEAAMAAGTLKAVVCTSTLDLGIDWGDVDLVINVGAPKGASRLIQRVGRANHRLDESSRALLVPANRFEVLECRAAIDAAAAGAHDAAVSVPARSMCWPSTCGARPARVPSNPTCSIAKSPPPRPMLRSTRRRSTASSISSPPAATRCRAYERYARLSPTGDGRLRLSHPRLAQQYRMNAGTIVESPMIKIRLVGRTRRARPAGPADRQRAAMAAACWASWRNTSSTSSASATPSPSPARCCASRACRTPTPS